MNHTRAGLYTVLGWMGFMLVVMKFQEDQSREHRLLLTNVMFYVLAPSALVGFGASWLFLRLSTHSILTKLRCVSPACLRPSPSLVERPDLLRFAARSVQLSSHMPAFPYHAPVNTAR